MPPVPVREETKKNTFGKNLVKNQERKKKDERRERSKLRE
jgi:hypothetical protein